MKVAESQSDRETYSRLQVVRSATLDGPGGQDAARGMLRFQQQYERGEGTNVWMGEGEGEGPAVSFGLASSMNSDGISPRIHLEAGLRDLFTSPRSRELLREVRFLSATVERRKSGIVGDFLLASLSSMRDMGRILQGASNGASAGYLGLPNSIGTSGLYASTWAGWSFRTESGWFGGRLSLTGDELQDRARVSLAPGLTWDILRDSWAFHTEVHQNFRSGLGWECQYDWILGQESTLLLKWLRSPLGENGFSVDFQFRF